VTDYEKNAIEISQAKTNNNDKLSLIDYEKKIKEIIISQEDNKNDDQGIAISQTHMKNNDQVNLIDYEKEAMEIGMFFFGLFS